MTTFAKSYSGENREDTYAAEQAIYDLLPRLTPRMAIYLAKSCCDKVLTYGVSYADFQSAQSANTNIVKARNLLRRVG